MVYGLQAVSFVVALFALFQLAMGALLLARKPMGATRLLSGILLLLNGLVSVGIVAQSLSPEPGWALRFILIFDGPSGLLLLMLGLFFHWQVDPEATGLGARARWAVTVALVVALVVSPIIWLNLQFYRDHVYGWYSQVPLWFGFAFVSHVLFHRMSSAASRARSTFYALVLVAYGSRAAQFVPQHVLNNWPKLRDEFILSGNPSLAADAVARLVFALVVIALMFILAFRIMRDSRGLRPKFMIVGAALLGSLVIGYVVSLNMGAPPLAGYTLDILTLVFVRPLLLGLAFERGSVTRTTGLVAAGFGSFVIAKGLFAGLFDRPFMQLSALDAAAGALVLVMAPVIMALPREDGSVARPTLGSAPPQAPEASHAHRLAAYLASTFGLPEGAGGVTQRQIEEATGIRSSNIAAELRRVERLLRAHLEPGQPQSPIVAVETRGIRGRKHYRLTPEGLAAAARLDGR